MAFLLELCGHFPGADDGKADVFSFPVRPPAGELGFLDGLGLPEVVEDDERVILVRLLGFIVHVI